MIATIENQNKGMIATIENQNKGMTATLCKPDRESE